MNNEDLRGIVKVELNVMVDWFNNKMKEYF